LDLYNAAVSSSVVVRAGAEIIKNVAANITPASTSASFFNRVNETFIIASSFLYEITNRGFNPENALAQ
jgi:hypothetical protein